MFIDLQDTSLPTTVDTTIALLARMLALGSLIALSATFLPKALAHGGVLAYSNAGNWYAGWQPYNSPTGQTSIERPWSTYNPITDATDPQLACNDDGTSGALQLTATVAAGSKITAYWNQVWPHAFGPMLTYLAQCPGTTCTGVNSNTLQWFKIDEAGLLSGSIGNGTWGDGIMIQQNSSWTTTIPSKVPSGNYLIRFETIALHSLPAQFYPECAQLQITGGGSLAPTSAELVSFPGAYTNTDPGLTVDLYTQEALTETSYPIPGPPLYAGAQPDYPAPTAPTTTPASQPTAPSGGSPPTTTSTGSAGGTVAEYGQCGGQGYTGPTTCAAPYTCHATNAYYSQCY